MGRVDPVGADPTRSPQRSERDIRHARYVGLVLIMIGIFLQSPALLAALIRPTPLVTDLRLARGEARQVEEAPRAGHRSPVRRVPWFLPRLRSPATATAP